ncbi:hypothetical protein [Streptomyces sp. NPDC088707]|uniref:hypothetical protein n=1 Tax=Streptomyces sp. NPDC088707 TaxID=3365871 RepID=UPI0038042366
MILGDHVIYPLRYAKKDVPVTAARLRRATGFRADPIRRHFDMGLDELDEQELYTHVVQDTQREAVSHIDRLLRSRPRS